MYGTANTLLMIDNRLTPEGDISITFVYGEGPSSVDSKRGYFDYSAYGRGSSLRSDLT